MSPQHRQSDLFLTLLQTDNFSCHDGGEFGRFLWPVELDIALLSRVEKESPLLPLADIQVWWAIVGDVMGNCTKDYVNHSRLQGRYLRRGKVLCSTSMIPV
jgi:hypothetical protein